MCIYIYITVTVCVYIQIYHTIFNYISICLEVSINSYMFQFVPSPASPRCHRQWQRETSRWPTVAAGDGWDAVAGFGTCAHRQTRCFPEADELQQPDIGNLSEEGKMEECIYIYIYIYGEAIGTRASENDKHVTAEVVF